ncbi:MAG: CAP domain-containing protein [Cyanobacteria bacterium J06638_20]
MTNRLIDLEKAVLNIKQVHPRKPRYVGALGIRFIPAVKSKNNAQVDESKAWQMIVAWAKGTNQSNADKETIINQIVAHYPKASQEVEHWSVETIKKYKEYKFTCSESGIAVVLSLNKELDQVEIKGPRKQKNKVPPKKALPEPPKNKPQKKKSLKATTEEVKTDKVFHKKQFPKTKDKTSTENSKSLIEQEIKKAWKKAGLKSPQAIHCASHDKKTANFKATLAKKKNTQEPTKRKQPTKYGSGRPWKTPADSKDLGTFEKMVLDAHNTCRAKSHHKTQPLTWNHKLAAYAQDWADQLAQWGYTPYTTPSPHRTLHNAAYYKGGENIYRAHAHNGKAPRLEESILDAMASWYSEVAYYNTLKAPILMKWNENGVEFTDEWIKYFLSTGHYYQMIWANTTMVGCGIAWYKGNPIVVCNYDVGPYYSEDSMKLKDGFTFNGDPKRQPLRWSNTGKYG